MTLCKIQSLIQNIVIIKIDLIKVNDKYGNICLELILWVILKLFMVLITVVPLSGGSVGLALAMGGITGRAYGEFLKMYFGV